MSTTKTKPDHVTFEAPFWIGLYERESDGAYEVCKITFGAEPKDYEVYEFLLRNWHGLSFSPKLQSSTLSERRLNPKRLQREIKRQLEPRGIARRRRRRSSFSMSRTKNCVKAQAARQERLGKSGAFCKNRSSAGKSTKDIGKTADRRSALFLYSFLIQNLAGV